MRAKLWRRPRRKRRRRACGVSADVIEGGADVLNDIVPVFEAEGDANAGGVGAGLKLLFGGKTGVSHGKRDFDKGFDLAQANSEGHAVGKLGDVVGKAIGGLAGGFVVALQDKIEHVAGSKLAVVADHLAPSKFALGKTIETGIDDVSNLGVGLQEFGDTHGGLLLVDDTSGQSGKAVDEKSPGSFGGENATEVAAVLHERH